MRSPLSKVATRHWRSNNCENPTALYTFVIDRGMASIGGKREESRDVAGGKDRFEHRTNRSYRIILLVVALWSNHSFGEVPVVDGDEPLLDPVVAQQPLPSLIDASEERPRNADELPTESDTLSIENVEPEPILGLRTELESSRKWKLTPHLTLLTTFDDNIFISERNKQSDLSGVFAPGIAFGLGEFRRELKEFGGYAERFEDDRENEATFADTRRFFFANYTVAPTGFIKHSEANSVDHDLSLAGQWTFQKLTVGFRAGFLTSSTPNVDFGGRLNQTMTSAAVTSRYDVSEKTSLEANFSWLNLEYEQQALASTEWKNENWLSYQIFPKTQIGVGLVVGQLEVQGGTPQTFEQALVRTLYIGSGKLFFNSELGVEFRQIEESGENRITPVFALGAKYMPFVATEITLRGSSRTLASTTNAGENYVITGVEGRIRQRFLRRFYVSVAAGFEKSVYESVAGRVGESRTDNVFFARPSLAFDVTKWASMEVAYQYREDASTIPGFSFTQNQATIQISMHY